MAVKVCFITTGFASLSREERWNKNGFFSAVSQITEAFLLCFMLPNPRNDAFLWEFAPTLTAPALNLLIWRNCGAGSCPQSAEGHVSHGLTKALPCRGPGLVTACRSHSSVPTWEQFFLFLFFGENRTSNSDGEDLRLRSTAAMSRKESSFVWTLYAAKLHWVWGIKCKPYYYTLKCIKIQWLYFLNPES